MWTKIGIIISTATIQLAVSIVYGLFKGSQTSLEGGLSFDIGSMLEFAGKMFVFSVPNVPWVFSVIWWIMSIAFWVAVILVVRGD